MPDLPIATANVDLTRSEFLLGTLAVTWRSLRWLAYIFVGAAIVGAVPAVVSPQYRNASTLKAALAPLGMLAVFAALAALGGSMSYARLPSDRLKCVWRFYPDHVEMASGSGSASLRWSAFVRIAESRTLFLFFVQHNLVHVLPMRSFSDPGARQELGKKADLKIGRGSGAG